MCFYILSFETIGKEISELLGGNFLTPIEKTERLYKACRTAQAVMSSC